MPKSKHTGSAPKRLKPISSDEDIRSLKIPTTGRWDYAVKMMPGLKVRVSATGVASFIVRAKGPRGSVAYTLGQFPALGFDEALERAAEWLPAIRRGEDPRTPKIDAGRYTLRMGFDWAMANRSSLRPRTREDYKGRWERHLADHAETPMADIDSAWVRERINDAQSNAKRGAGIVEANRLRSLLGTIFTDWCELNPGKAHPVRSVRKATDANGRSSKPRKNKLTIEQARAYAQAIERYAAGEGLPSRTIDGEYTKRNRRAMADFLLLNMRVGLRRSNGLGLRWEWIDFDAGTITIPAESMKTDNALQVNAPPPVLTMLKRRLKEAKGPYALVFPGRRDPSKPMNSPAKAHEAVLKLAGLPKNAVTIHDMRRTLGSAMIATGADISAVRHQLGHSNIATTSIYLNLDGEDTVKDSLAQVSRAFDAEVEEENAA